mmetsp:Transcript_110999/g.312960  ORF Transcript_110999/g.312960 Transcript_110999/m.312960 type:complete len:629 (+) Transcript_110999:66-1952(+)
MPPSLVMTDSDNEEEAPRPRSAGRNTSSRATTTLPLRSDVLLSHTIFEEELDAGISEDVLRRLTGNDDLESVELLEMRVDTVSGDQQVERIGERLPNLTQLRLSNSSLLTIRDLGTSLSKLRVLWLNQSALQDIGGVVVLPVLEELYIAFNDVRDLSPLCMHEALQVLDIEGNLVEDMSEIEGLNTVNTLRELTLTDNPLCKSENFSRDLVLGCLPQLVILDDIPRGESTTVRPIIPALDADFEIGDLTTDAGETSLEEPELILADVQESFALLNLRRRSENGVPNRASSSTRPRTADAPSPAHDPLSQKPCATPVSPSTAQPRQMLRCESTPQAASSSPWPRAAFPDEDDPHSASGDNADTEARTSQAVAELRARCSQLRKQPEGSTVDAPLKEEPSEQELVVEGVKRSRQPVPDLRNGSMTDRNSIGSGKFRPSSSGFFAPAPRGAWMSNSSVSTSYRPSTAASDTASCWSARFSAVSAGQSAISEADASASDLTQGEDGRVLAGNPLEAVRRRRRAAEARGEDTTSIRDLLRRFEGSQGVAEESPTAQPGPDFLQRQASLRRLEATGFRIRPGTSSGTSRPGSSAGTAKRKKGLPRRPETRCGTPAPEIETPSLTAGFAEVLLLE